MHNAAANNNNVPCVSIEGIEGYIRSSRTSYLSVYFLYILVRRYPQFKFAVLILLSIVKLKK